MLIFCIKFILVPLFILFLLAILRTWEMEHSENQKMFLAGTFPTSLMDGFYNGGLVGLKVRWLGKRFNSLNQTGVNIFDPRIWGKKERYPFITYAGKGLRDKNKDVLKIDYNIKNSPFTSRLILDEIVQIAPDQYLGKFHVRIIPNYPFTLGYFYLKK